MNESQLVLEGYGGRSIHCSLLDPRGSSDRLAVILPGAGYNCDRPLMYYAAEVLLAKKTRVLQIHTDYSRTDKYKELFRTKDATELDKWIMADAECISKYLAQNFPVPIILVGKSMGTFAMTQISPNLELIQCVWLTPWLRDRWESIRNLCEDNLVVIGTADPHFEACQPHFPPRSLIVDRADHALEIPGRPTESVEILEDVVRFLDEGIC